MSVSLVRTSNLVMDNLQSRNSCTGFFWLRVRQSIENDHGLCLINSRQVLVDFFFSAHVWIKENQGELQPHVMGVLHVLAFYDLFLI